MLGSFKRSFSGSTLKNLAQAGHKQFSTTSHMHPPTPTQRFTALSDLKNINAGTSKLFFNVPPPLAALATSASKQLLRSGDAKGFSIEYATEGEPVLVIESLEQNGVPADQMIEVANQLQNQINQICVFLADPPVRPSIFFSDNGGIKALSIPSELGELLQVFIDSLGRGEQIKLVCNYKDAIDFNDLHRDPLDLSHRNYVIKGLDADLKSFFVAVNENLTGLIQNKNALKNQF
jgi:hypothetical protein